MPILFSGPDDNEYDGLGVQVFGGDELLDQGGGATNRLLLENGNGLQLEDASGDVELQ